jgi:hypothetical protein
MQSTNDNPPGLLRFPSVARASAASATEEDKAIAHAHHARRSTNSSETPLSHCRSSITASPKPSWILWIRWT